MTEGIIARFRTMAVARSSVLTGHVVGATIQTVVSMSWLLPRRHSRSASGRTRTWRSGSPPSSG